MRLGETKNWNETSFLLVLIFQRKKPLERDEILVSRLEKRGESYPLRKRPFFADSAVK